MLSYIYVIGSNTKPYKIGLTKDPKRRLKNIQTGNFNELKIHYLEEIDNSEVTFIEKMIHKNLSHKRTHGEWFDLDLEEAISEVKFARIRYSKE